MLEDKETYKLLKTISKKNYVGQKFLFSEKFNSESFKFLQRNGYVEDAHIKNENRSYKITNKGKNELVKSFRDKITFYLSIFAIILSITAIVVSIISLN